MTTKPERLRLPVPQAARFDRFLKRRYVKPGQTVLDRKRIFILPTYHGLAFGASLFVMLMGSLNYNNSLGFVLTFLLAGVMLIATFHTYRNLRHLNVKAVRVSPCFAEQNAQFIIVLENQDSLPRVAIFVKALNQTPVALDVPRASSALATLTVPAPRRGRLPLGIVTVETRFPLGLYHAWSYVNLEMQALVYPKPAPAEQFAMPQHSGFGSLDATQRGAEDFGGLRSYQSGDSTRHIHWKTWARNETLVTKHFTQPTSQEVWFDYEQAPGDEVEAKLSVLCRWILDAQAAGLNYGLRMPDQIIDPANGEHHHHRCLETLALFAAP